MAGKTVVERLISIPPPAISLDYGGGISEICLIFQMTRITQTRIILE